MLSNMSLELSRKKDDETNHNYMYTKKGIDAVVGEGTLSLSNMSLEVAKKDGETNHNYM